MTVENNLKVVPPGSSMPVGTGPPTKQEMLEHYPAKFTWEQLKTFINSGDLGLLKRHRKLQLRYNVWNKGIKQQYGTIESYLLNYRLQWGKPDRLSVLRPYIAEDEESATNGVNPVPPAVEYFTADTPPHLISIILNDWPYSVPPEIEHSLIWTRQQIFHPAIIPEAISKRVDRDGLWGFTGLTSPPPSPSNLPSCLPALADWNIPLDLQVKYVQGTDEEEEMVRRASEGVNEFVKLKWPENLFETAWFVNPPALQSVRGLAHVHVFARRKPEEEIV